MSRESDDLCFETLTAVGALLERGDLSPVELTRRVLGRIEARDGELHSYLTVLPERALAAAARAEREISAGGRRGALHGIPIGIKDLCATRGVATTCASRVFAGRVPDHDATVVARLEAAGAIVVGKLNLTEFALVGYHPSLPVPRNPWDAAYHAGGSSSGSAVALASGLCFGAIGTDTGGSIRIPASWNGVVGLKPTWGRVSRHGVFPLSASLDHVGPMTRSVADAAAMFEAIAGFDPADPTSLRAPVPDCVAGLGRGVRGLRLGIDEDYTRGGALPEMVEAVAAAVRVLEGLGAEVVPVRLPPVDAVLAAWTPLCSADALVAHAATFPSRAAEYGPTMRTFLEIGARLGAADYAAAHAARLEFAGGLAGVFERADALVCPGSFGPALPAAALDPQMPYAEDLAPAFQRYSAPFNASGSPTLSLPGGFTDQGLPLGVQLVGRPLEEDLLCRIGFAYQQVTDWHARRPPVAR